VCEERGRGGRKSVCKGVLCVCVNGGSMPICHGHLATKEAEHIIYIIYISVYTYNIYIRPTQAVMCVPLQVNRFAENILLVVQYRYSKSCSGDFYSPESDPPHKFMRYWFYYSIWLGFSFPPDRICQVEIGFVLAVYQFRKGISAGPALQYFTIFIGAGGCSATLQRRQLSI